MQEMTYNEIIQKAGKRVIKHVYYTLNGNVINVDDSNVKRVKLSFKSSLVGTIMQGCELTLKEPISGIIYVEVEARYSSDTATKIYGPYQLKEEPTYDASDKSYTHYLYDNVMLSMKDYTPINITYPTTIYNYFSELVNELGYTTNIASLPNGNITMASDIYEGINYTFRDVLDDIAEANGVLFYIDGMELKIASLGNTPITINDKILKKQNIAFSEHFGPINVITLSRAGGSDNIYYPSTLPENIHEFKISDNQLMSDNNRDVFLPAIYSQLNGIEYDIFDTELVGYGDIQPLQKVQFATGGKTFNSYIFNQEIVLTTGYKQSIYTDMPEETTTDYKYADTTDKRINQTQIIVDKQNGVIQSLVEKVVDISSTKTGVGSVTLESALSGPLHYLSIKGQVDMLYPTKVNGGIVIKHNYTQEDLETLIGCIAGTITPTQEEFDYLDTNSDGNLDALDMALMNEIINHKSRPYNAQIIYPSSNLYTFSKTLMIDDEPYELDINYLNYMDNTTYDEFVYQDGNCYIIRRVGIDKNGDMYALSDEVIEERNPIILNVNYDSTIALKSFDNCIYTVTYLLENDYTTTFANKAEVSSEIKQTADSINLRVDSKLDEGEYTGANILLKINRDESETQINADKININGVTSINNNFQIDTNGNPIIQGGTIQVTNNDGGQAFTIVNTDKTRKLEISGNYIRLYTSTDGLYWWSSANLQFSETEITVNGGFVVTGNKNRLVTIDDGSQVKINAYETAEPYFGDIGSSKTNEFGYAKIEIENIFAQTIENDDYKVFVQECGEGYLYVEKYDNYFEVKGTPNLDFDYEIKAIQKGYKNVRLQKKESD